MSTCAWRWSSTATRASWSAASRTWTRRWRWSASAAGWRSSSRSARRSNSRRPTASRSFRGTHGIGHTRLSTESRVDLSHSQPFWAHGVPDLATVHNGHITNYHKLRRRYEQRGVRFYTENDSEVIGVYLARPPGGGPVARGCAAVVARRPRRLLQLPGRDGATRSASPRTRFALQAADRRRDRRLRRHRHRGDRHPRGVPAATLTTAREAQAKEVRVWRRSRGATTHRLRRQATREINARDQAADRGREQTDSSCSNPARGTTSASRCCEPVQRRLRRQRRLLLRRDDRRRDRRDPRQRRLGPGRVDAGRHGDRARQRRQRRGGVDPRRHGRRPTATPRRGPASR